MNLPFKVIESKITSRNEFQMLEGCQPTHALFYLKEGEFELEIGGVSQKIKAGDCVVLPDYVEFHRSVLNPIVFVYVKFACVLESEFNFELPYGKVEFKDKKRFYSSISNFEALLNVDNSFAVSYRNHLLTDILLQIYFESNPIENPLTQTTCRDRLVLSAVEYIDNHISQKITVGDICRSLGTNASTLSFKFRNCFSMSVGQYIIGKRIKKAVHLLCGTTYAISEIAFRCGFENVYYFSNTFKKHTGFSPSEYRKTMLK